MNGDNTFYGHSAILARYAGLGHRVPPIWGYLQHGVNHGTGLPASYRPVRGLNVLVWNDRNRSAAVECGMRNVQCIGAPLAYLNQMLRSRGLHRAIEAAGTIAYPVHSWSGGELDATHDNLAAQLLGHESANLTVCLYWRDYDDTMVRRAYEDRGIRVICHGTLHDPAFLVRLWHEQMSHARVVSNRVNTALWYGAYLGREVEAYGDAFMASSDPEGVDWDAYQREHWPYFFDERHDPEVIGVLAQKELTPASGLLEPEELKPLLGWTIPKRLLAPLVDSVVRARRRIKGLAYVPPRRGLWEKDLRRTG